LGKISTLDSSPESFAFGIVTVGVERTEANATETEGVVGFVVGAATAAAFQCAATVLVQAYARNGAR